MLRVSHVRCSWVATCQGGGKGIIIDNGYPILLRDPISCMPITRDQDSALGERRSTYLAMQSRGYAHVFLPKTYPIHSNVCAFALGIVE